MASAIPMEKGSSTLDEKRQVVSPPSEESREVDEEYEANVEILRNMSAEEYEAYEKKLLWRCDRKIVPWMTVSPATFFQFLPLCTHNETTVETRH
jgi:hypothetical protein